MTNFHRLFRQRAWLVVLVWWLSTLPGFAADPGSDRSGGADARFATYAAEVQAGIKEALLLNNQTRTASISGVVVRIWIDKTGRVTRAQLGGTTGTPSLDLAITNEVLTGLQLKTPPPADMPMPIALRLSARPDSSGVYVTRAQLSIEEALNQNNKTSTALISGLLIRIWVDSRGRITRAQLGSTMGNPSLDNAIANEVLPGLQLKQAPPPDMPMPIVVRVTTHRPI
jgi:hypothetical protein